MNFNNAFTTSLTLLLILLYYFWMLGEVVTLFTN